MMHWIYFIFAFVCFVFLQYSVSEWFATFQNKWIKFLFSILFVLVSYVGYAAMIIATLFIL